MDEKFKKQIVADSETVEKMAQKICGYGHYAYENDDRDHPIPINVVELYLQRAEYD